MTPPRTKKKTFDAQALIDEQVATLDEAIEKIEARMRPYEALAQKKQQLLAARRALLGHGPRTTGGTTNKLTIDDLIAWVREHPGTTPGETAQHFGVTQTVVSSHFYRNKQRFISKDGRYWVRDPKAGLNTAEDIDDEGDE